jgi:hypothetical protein
MLGENAADKDDFSSKGMAAIKATDRIRIIGFTLIQ